MAGYQPMDAAEIQKVARIYFDERAKRTQASDSPVFVAVAGQPGAGKSAAAQMVRDELAGAGGFIHLDADRMRERIDTGGVSYPSSETQKDAGALVGALRELTLGAKRNALEEGTFRATEGVLRDVAARQALGYRVEVVAVATPPAESLLGIYQRHEMQHVSGSKNPRFVAKSYHDESMAGFEKTLQGVQSLADRTRVITRDGAVLYDSAREQNKHADAMAALKAGQQLTPERLRQVQNGWAIVGELAKSRGASPEYLGTVRENASDAERLRAPTANKGASALVSFLEEAAKRGITPKTQTPSTPKPPTRDNGPSR